MLWDDLSQAQAKGMLRQGLASGYSEWFATTSERISWAWVDTSAGGSWGPNGAQVTTYSIPYDREIVRLLYLLR